LTVFNIQLVALDPFSQILVRDDEVIAKHREIQTTEGGLKVAAGNVWSGKEVMQLLFN
jgi:hypothetical protein